MRGGEKGSLSAVTTTTDISPIGSPSHEEMERSGAEMPVRWEVLRERGQEPLCWAIQSQTERRDRDQTEKSWRLFEGIDMFLYGLVRKSKIGSFSHGKRRRVP